MARLFRWALVRRFWSGLREEGVRPTLRKARIFVGMQLRGRAPSVFGAAPQVGGGTAPEHTMVGLWAEMARGGGFHVARRAPPPARIALIGDLNLPQCRKYRVEQLAAFWQAQGVACDYAHYQDIPRAIRLMQDATHVCEYRLQVMPVTTMLRFEARRLGLPVLYDIDDPLFSVSAYETYGNMAEVDPGLKAHFVAEAPRYAEMMNGADLVTVSTPGLAAHARLYTRRPVHLRRNFADAETLEAGARAMAARGAPDGVFRVVFASGSQGHEADFMQIAQVLTEVITAAPGRELLILGHFDLAKLPPALVARTVHHRFVPYARYLSELAAADVAVMPLADDIFNRCKSAVRVIDAASVGVPAVVSDIGDLPALIAAGQTGHVARGTQDWREALGRLAADPGRARAMGQAARAALETRWSGAAAGAAAHILSPEVMDWIRS